MKIMCDFANGKTPNSFVHPALRAIILHFWLAYDHPFTDGNGRTARALFYWSMLRSDFWLFEFISISSIIRKAPAQYARSFLYTESDDNDLTYFVLGQIKVIMKALEELVQYVKRKTKQVRVMEAELRGVEVLNHRQKALISHALRHPQHRYSIESHKRSHNVVYQTARSDLLNMVERGLLIKNKIGRRLYFSPVPDLNKSLVILG
jgi:Fic family protein